MASPLNNLVSYATNLAGYAFSSSGDAIRPGASRAATNREPETTNQGYVASLIDMMKRLAFGENFTTIEDSDSNEEEISEIQGSSSVSTSSGNSPTTTADLLQSTQSSPALLMTIDEKESPAPATIGESESDEEEIFQIQGSSSVSASSSDGDSPTTTADLPQSTQSSPALLRRKVYSHSRKHANHHESVSSPKTEAVSDPAAPNYDRSQFSQLLKLIANGTIKDIKRHAKNLANDLFQLQVQRLCAIWEENPLYLGAEDKVRAFISYKIQNVSHSDERKKLIKLFSKTAEYSLKLNDFQSASTLYRVLKDPKISEISKLQDECEKKQKLSIPQEAKSATRFTELFEQLKNVRQDPKTYRWNSDFVWVDILNLNK